MSALFILLAVIAGMATVVLLLGAAVLNAAWMIVAAVGAGLLTWLFSYMINETELF